MTIAHEVLGPPDAPVLVLLNSLGSTRAMWDPQVGPLSDRLRVVRTDARGHGESVVVDGPWTVADLGRDVLELLDELGVARAHLVGLSLGGATAQWIAVHAPDRVHTLSLLCTSAHWPDVQPWIDRAAAVRADGVASIAPAVVDRWFTPELAQRDPALVAWAQDMVASTPAEGYATACEALATWDGRGDLGRITAPTLVVAGDVDPATPPAMLREIAEGIPGAALHVLPRASHLANLEQAGTVTRLLLAHVLGQGPYEQGLATRRAVLGDAHVDRALAGVTPFTADWQDFITRTAWGDVWNRPGLDRRTRSVITLTALVALGSEHELALHVRAAVTNGLTEDEIGEVLLHTAVYAGVPRSNRAFAVAQEALHPTAPPL
jgi:3-oxoadipate enol-lactonase/4-carboxymuconolactone decarboxylase